MDKVITNIQQGIADEMAIVVLDLIALVEARVKNQGKNVDGAYFKPYAKKTVEIRGEAGLQTSFKDFTFTNTMWRDLDLLETRIDGGNVVNEVGFRTVRSSKIYDDNCEREKRQIIEPNKDELELIGDSVLEWIGEKLDNYGKDNN